MWLCTAVQNKPHMSHTHTTHTQRKSPPPPIQLPVVQSYPLDLPTDPAARALFERDVEAIFGRITGSKSRPACPAPAKKAKASDP